jgi:dipeptidyl aminopeptidase/acylaminoacyl peptidase
MKLNLVVIGLLSIGAPASAQALRPLVVDDLFQLQTLEDVRVSPDGSSVAMVIQRAWADPETYRPYDMFGNDHADIWILPGSGGAPKNITNGRSQGSGYWNPVWSPDGQRLAMLSTAGGDNVRAYVWDKRTERLQRLSELGVDMYAAMSATGRISPLQWVDDRRVLVPALPAGEQPVSFRLRRQTPRIATDAWKKTAQGQETTASILDAGMTEDRPERAAQLLLIDVVTMQARTLVTGNTRYALLSPDRQALAVMTLGRRRASQPGQLLGDQYSARSRVGIISLRGESAIRWVESLSNLVVAFGPHPHRWSPRGSLLAVLASERPESGSSRSVFLISPTDLSVRKATTTLSPTAIEWSEDDHLLVRAAAPEGRFDWWSVSITGEEPRNITGAMPSAPSQLVRTPSGHEAIGLADGALWHFNFKQRNARTVEAGSAVFESVVWPAEEERAAAPVQSIIVRVRENGVTALRRVDLAAGSHVSSFAQPPRSTALAAYHPGQNLAVFTAPRHPDGTFLWTGRGGTSDFVERLALNQQLAGIAGGEPLLIDYRSTTGEELKAILLLPATYQRGTRYPLVVSAYPGMIFREVTSAFWVNKNQAHQDNLHILAAQGYAVLLPSMPTADNARRYRELPAGVLPAIDRVVELGIADPDRVAVMGQSGGGFATYGLITQTNRFKSAVAINGVANSSSAYGTFSGQDRYTDEVDDKHVLGGPASGPLGAPPWQDPERYVVNSPLFFLDRVDTPLLIIHGDLDYVPIQQAEEVFTSLARLGKRVRFVRYWGESHGASDSAANARDRWRQILRWLDTYLRDAP